MFKGLSIAFACFAALISPAPASILHVGRGSDMPAASPAPLLKKSPIVFIKTHSTGSSTMTNILHRLCASYSLSCFVPPNSYQPGATMYREDLEEFARMQKKEHRWDIWPQHTNLEPDLFDQMFPGNFKVSIYRNPLDRAVSSFAHDEDELKDAIHKLSKNRFPKYHVCFCGCAGMPMSNQTRLEDFDKVDLVILTEEMDLGLLLLRKRFGLRLRDIVYYQLKSSEELDPLKKQLRSMFTKPASAMNKATRTMWERCTQGSEKLIYKRARGKFDAQMAALSPTERNTLLKTAEVFRGTVAKVKACCGRTPGDPYCRVISEDNVEWVTRMRMQDLHASGSACLQLVPE